MEVVGFIPAAGMGRRMKPFLLIKELLPIRFVMGKEKVSLLFENSFQTFEYSNISSIICTISKEKDDLRNYMLKYVSQNDILQLAFVYQDFHAGEYGLPYAIKAASRFLKGKTVVMRFPDTVVTPVDCINDILELHRRKKADVTLGVFPTNNPERLAPVIIDNDGRVLKVEDKPEKPSAQNTWNCVVWEESFMKEVLNYIDDMKNVHKEMIS